MYNRHEETVNSAAGLATSAPAFSLTVNVQRNTRHTSTDIVTRVASTSQSCTHSIPFPLDVPASPPIGTDPSTRSWGSWKWRGLVEWGSWGADVPLQLAMGVGSAVSSPSWVRDKAPATWRSRTFYRLTKPLLMLILLILNLFQ